MLKTSMSYKIAHRTTTSKILKKNACASVIFVQRRQMSPLLNIVAVQKYRWHMLNHVVIRIFLKNNIGKVSSRSKQNSSIVCLF